ncbi:hypothetical protein N9L92_00400 [Saprospiraceae bacterium]|nr:hypothetical protein [Saprospiraceae bacterium]
MIENFGNKLRTNGLDKNPSNINKNGRQPSIKNQLKELAASDGFIEYPIEDVEILDDKVRIRIPHQNAIAQKLWTWAMSKKGNESIKAIQIIMNQIDGKPTQSISANIDSMKPLVIDWQEEKN